MYKDKFKMLGKVAAAISFVMLLIWVMFFRLPSTYSAMPISGQVADADSGEPLEKAIVIAVWELERGFGLEGTIPSGFMQVTEVLTDVEGKYFIDGWGPSSRQGGMYMGHNAPRLVIFKDGYDVFARGNLYDSIFKDNRRETIHQSSWDGETIKLKKLDGDMESYLNILSILSRNLHTLLNLNFGASPCDWLKIPRTIVSIETGYQKVIKAGIRTSLIVPIDVLIKREECNVNSKDAFIKEHML